MSSRNPDFEYDPPIAGATQRLREIAATHRAVFGDEVDRLIAALEQRDKHLEDWLNRNVVRRIQIASVAGDDTVHDATAWEDVEPEVSHSVVKASPRSALAVQIDASGLFADASPPHNVELGVRVSGPGGYDTDFSVVSRTGDATVQYLVLSGGALVALGVPRGTYAVRLRVQVEAGGVTWTSTPGNSLSVSVTETAVF